MSEQTTNTQPQLNLNDLIFVLQAFQMASNRGAFKPEEFTAVGGCYERIFAFLESQGAVKKSEQKDQTQGNQND